MTRLLVRFQSGANCKWSSMAYLTYYFWLTSGSAVTFLGFAKRTKLMELSINHIMYNVIDEKKEKTSQHSRRCRFLRTLFVIPC
jgi:hypothetical protein